MTFRFTQFTRRAIRNTRILRPPQSEHVSGAADADEARPGTGNFRVISYLTSQKSSADVLV